MRATPSFCHLIPSLEQQDMSSPRSEGYISFVHLGGKYVERVLRFKYLGSMMSEDGSLGDEVNNRIGAAQAAFHKFPRELWASESMPLYVKWELYKHLVMTRLVYGAEAWVEPWQMRRGWKGCTSNTYEY